MVYELIDEMFLQLLEQDHGVLGVLRRDRGAASMWRSTCMPRAGIWLIAKIRHALCLHDLPGSTLLFKLTINGLLDMRFTTLESLLRLRMMAYGLAIDDFGVGFFVLKLLCQVPSIQIKLDGGCVQNLWDSHCRTVVSCPMALAD